MVLLRRVIGDALRARRQAQHRTLREVSTAANVSLGYLSEIERGQKEPSSELLSAVCEALGAHLSELLREVSFSVEHAERGTSPAGTPAVGGRPAAAPGGDSRPAAAPAGESSSRPAVPTSPDPMAPAAHAGAPAARVAAARVTPTRPSRAAAPAAKSTVTRHAVANPAVLVDGDVAVTVRQDGPLRATLHTTRTRRTDRERDALAQV